MANKGKLRNDLVRELCEYLVGTCKTLDEGVQEICGQDKEASSLTQSTLEAIDEIMLCCETCGWWCEVEDKSMEGDNVCIECNNE